MRSQTASFCRRPSPGCGRRPVRRSHPLGDDQFGGSGDFLAKRLPDQWRQSRCPRRWWNRPESGSWAFQQGPRNAKTLLLAAGHVGAALLDAGVVSVGEGPDELVSLGRRQAAPSSSVACGSPQRRFSLIVPENSTCFCRTTATCSRNARYRIPGYLRRRPGRAPLWRRKAWGSAASAWIFPLPVPPIMPTVWPDSTLKSNIARHSFPGSPGVAKADLFKVHRPVGHLPSGAYPGFQIRLFPRAPRRSFRRRSAAIVISTDTMDSIIRLDRICMT